MDERAGEAGRGGVAVEMASLPPASEDQYVYDEDEYDMEEDDDAKGEDTAAASASTTSPTPTSTTATAASASATSTRLARRSLSSSSARGSASPATATATTATSPLGGTAADGGRAGMSFHAGVGGAPSFLVLDTASIRRERDRVVSEVSELLGMTPFEAESVLMEFHWKKEKLLNFVFERGGNHDALVSAGAAVPSGQPPTTAAADGDEKEPQQCGICFDDLDYSEGAASAVTNETCGHTFCASCWRQHLIVKVAEEGKARRIPCMKHKCGAKVTPTVLRSVDLPSAVLERYDKDVLDSFVEDNGKVTWCPSVPFCGAALVLSDSTSARTDVECGCGEVFCFKCGGPTHTPVPCEWAKQWMEKSENESATSKFIAANCKPCPKCQKTIIKVDGCNHVTCPCGQSMCWLCGAPTGRVHTWDSIEGHKCERFALEAKTEAAKARVELERYIHYYSRYEAHMQSLKKASEVRSTVNATIEALEKAHKTNRSADGKLADWLWIGLYQLLRIRHFVAWSWAFAYYAFNTPELKAHFEPHQALYEDFQARLQQACEELSRLVEMQPDKMTDTTKAEVLAFAFKTHAHALGLYDLVANRMMADGASGVPPPSPYFPIRKMVVGLGAKGLEDAPSASSPRASLSSSSGASHAAVVSSATVDVAPAAAPQAAHATQAASPARKKRRHSQQRNRGR